MDLQHFVSPLLVWDADFDFSVKSAWASKRWVKCAWSVSRADDDYVASAGQAVH
jgi:hypothetical protein